MFNQLNIAIHQFSKRQMTWFRKMEREGFAIHWINAEFITGRKNKNYISTAQCHRMKSGKRFIY